MARASSVCVRQLGDNGCRWRADDDWEAEQPVMPFGSGQAFGVAETGDLSGDFGVQHWSLLWLIRCIHDAPLR
jgi:hypothetical protein